MNLRPSGYEPDELPCCSTRDNIKFKNGGGRGIRTPRDSRRLSVFKTDPFSRTWVYLHEGKRNILLFMSKPLKNGGGRGFEPRFSPPVGFQDRSLQPNLGIPPRHIINKVEPSGIEPLTSCVQGRRSPAELRPHVLGISGRQDLNLRPLVPNQVLYQAEPLPVNKSAPERSRTPNLLIRSQTLYPIELRAHMVPRGVERTVVTHRRILSPVRLPVPPPRHVILKIGAEDGIRTRPQPWQGCILPLNYFRKTCMSYFIKSA